MESVASTAPISNIEMNTFTTNADKNNNTSALNYLKLTKEKLNSSFSKFQRFLIHINVTRFFSSESIHKLIKINKISTLIEKSSTQLSNISGTKLSNILDNKKKEKALNIIISNYPKLKGNIPALTYLSSEKGMKYFYAVHDSQITKKDKGKVLLGLCNAKNKKAYMKNFHLERKVCFELAKLKSLRMAQKQGFSVDKTDKKVVQDFKRETVNKYGISSIEIMNENSDKFTYTDFHKLDPTDFVDNISKIDNPYKCSIKIKYSGQN